MPTFRGTVDVPLYLVVEADDYVEAERMVDDAISEAWQLAQDSLRLHSVSLGQRYNDTYVDVQTDGPNAAEFPDAPGIMWDEV